MKVRRPQILAVVLATTLWVPAVAACARDAPELSLPVTPVTAYERLTSDDGKKFVEDISTYDWSDSGQAASSYFSWIASDASSPDNDAAARAGTSANVLALFLANSRPRLEALPHGIFGLQRSSIGAVNPDLVSAYAEALTPYQGAIAGGETNLAGFQSFEESQHGDFTMARNVFAVISTEADAGRQFADSANELARQVSSDAARQVCSGDATAPSGTPAAIRLAGALSGLAASVSPSAKASYQVSDDVSYAMAAECLSVTAIPPEGQIRDYIKAGKLMSPEAVEQERNEGLEDFYQSMRDYLNTYDLPITDFEDWYGKARGSQ